jgi:hypothetical protein
VVLSGANVRDDKLLEATLDAVVVTERPQPTEKAPQHLCLETRATTTVGPGSLWRSEAT